MILQSAFGLVAITGFAFLIGLRGAKVWWGDRVRVAVAGVVFQILLAWTLLELPGARAFFASLGAAIEALKAASVAGSSLVFGYHGGAEPPFEQARVGLVFIFAFEALPLVLVVSALSSLLFYWRILPAVVRCFSWALQKVFGVGGAVGVAVAANIFIGMMEASLMIRPYLSRLSRSELFVVLTAGMATITGSVIVLYAHFLRDVVPDAAGHLLVASIISAPAAIIIARLMLPEDREATSGRVVQEDSPGSAMEAIVRGTLDGVQLVINIVAMLIVLVALVHLANAILAQLPMISGTPITLQGALGWCLSPLAWLMGIPWEEATTAGQLLGTKIILNELVAYLDLSKLPADALSERSRVIMTYALCGFANFGSAGIMIGGLATVVPERRREIVGLALRAIVSGTLAACMTGAVVGLF